MESQNEPVEFYGKVVDQDGDALANATVRVKVRHWKVVTPVAFGAEGQMVPLQRETDADGRFEINEATGDAFDLESIEKPGYKLQPTKRSYAATGGSIADPVVFTMWSTNIHAQLMTGKKSFQIVPDGRPYVIDLTQGTVAESGKGDLKVWIKYPEQVVDGQLYDWSSEIAVLNGGLMEETNLNSPMYMAPEDSYQPTFQYNQQIKGGQYGSTGTKRFYVRLKDGQEYGRITIELYAPYTDQVPGLVRIQYAINPTGSRVLR